MMTKRYHGTRREVNDMLTRLQAQPPPPVSERDKTPSKDSVTCLTDNKDEEMEEEDEGEKEEGATTEEEMEEVEGREEEDASTDGSLTPRQTHHLVLKLPTLDNQTS